MTEYRTTEEKKYFGSDYNKFLHTDCSKKMTVNNIDVIQYKREKKIIRICESKHKNEKMPFTQKEILDKLAWIFELLNKTQKKYTFEIFVIRGNPPYDSVEITNLISNDMFSLDKNQFIEWSSFNT